MKNEKLEMLIEDALFEEDGLTDERMEGIVRELMALPEEEALAFIAQTELGVEDRQRLEEAVLKAQAAEKKDGAGRDLEWTETPETNGAEKYESSRTNKLQDLEQDVLFEEGMEDETLARLCEELEAMPEKEAMRHIDKMDLSREEKQALRDALRDESM